MQLHMKEYLHMINKLPVWRQNCQAVIFADIFQIFRIAVKQQMVFEGWR